ncbi:MAG: C25 family cysteine peptidase [Bacteroidales bacterium]|jgi:hypothetical protein|nr:C25 family cysteine peptidase [Bacteroidales bacterium]
MKKFFFLILLVISIVSFSQNSATSIILNTKSEKTGLAIKEDLVSSFVATYSFNELKFINKSVNNENFTQLQIYQSYPFGNFGSPQLPQIRDLINIPLNSSINLEIISFSETDINLSDYEISKIFPNQPDVRKDQTTVDFIYHNQEYLTNEFTNLPIANIIQLGNLRGLNLGELQINPIVYNPVENKIKIFNDIVIEVTFDKADVERTRTMINKTINPYFSSIYNKVINKTIFQKLTKDSFDDHPDFWHSPVKMLVIADDMFQESLQPWIEWKTQKGFYVDVNYKSTIGNDYTSIQNFIHQKYNTGLSEGNAPTFLVLVGDILQIPSGVGINTEVASDLYYASVDGDMFPEMYHSRISVETTAELDNFIEKLLYYEKYQIEDPSYLNNVLLVAGEDSYWNFHEAQPTVRFAENYFFNEDHGFENVYAYYDEYTNCYNRFNTGVGFANYSAHGGSDCWAGPYFGVSSVNALTNVNKYFWAIGNCCQSGAFSTTTCLGEGIIRAHQKGGFAYIGSVPNTWWGADFYWTVGFPSNGIADQITFTPTFEETEKGMYEMFFDDSQYNTISSLMFTGNLAVTFHDPGYASQYYFEAYHTFGDGSVMPFRTEPTINEVACIPVIFLEHSQFNLTAEPSSYAAISKNGQLLGVGYADPAGNITINFDTPITEEGEYLLVVTCPQKIPYFQNLNAFPLNGELIVKMNHYLDGDGLLAYNETANLSLRIKNAGTETSENLILTLSCNDPLITISNPIFHYNPLSQNDEVLLENIYELIVSPDIENMHLFNFILSIQSGDNQWEFNFNYTAYKPILNYINFETIGDIVDNQDFIIKVSTNNLSHLSSFNTIAYLSSADNNVIIENLDYYIGEIAFNQTKDAYFLVKFTDISEEILHNFHFIVAGDNGMVSTSADFCILNQNKCSIILNLLDDYGDGWQGYGDIALIMSFSDGSPSQTFLMQNPEPYPAHNHHTETHIFNILKNTEITLTWIIDDGTNYIDEISFLITYADGTTIINTTQDIAINGLSYSFINTCNCDTSADCNIISDINVQNISVEENNAVVSLSISNSSENQFIMYKLLRNGVLIAILNPDITNYIDIVPIDYQNLNQTYSLIPVCNTGNLSNISTITTSLIDVPINSTITLDIYPNPVENNQVVKIIPYENYLITILDINGKVIKNIKNTSAFNAPSVPGTYLINISSNTLNNNIKLIVY